MLYNQDLKPLNPSNFNWFGVLKIDGGAVRCGALRCVAVRCGALRCGAVRCGAVRCGAVRCGAVRCGAVRCGAVRCGAVRCGAVRCGAVRCGAVRCGAVRCGFSGSELVHLKINIMPEARKKPPSNHEFHNQWIYYFFHDLIQSFFTQFLKWLQCEMNVSQYGSTKYSKTSNIVN